MKLEGVYKSFDEIKVLHNINLNINDKEITCILGPSGCGKSTLLNIMAGILKPDAGRVTNLNQKVGYVFQEDRLLPWKTVYENIRLVNKKSADKKIMELIDVVGLQGFEKKFPDQLSGGMRQRCSIARAFNFESQLLLMDEPFKSLDYDLRLTMVGSLIDIWSKWNNSVIFVTADYKLAASTVWGLLYLVGNEELNINDWEDLKGKEIYTMGRGLTPDIVFRYLLSSNGINPDTDLTLTYVGEATELASAFIGGKSTISVIPEPMLSNVMAKKADTVILMDLQEEWSKLNNGNSSYPQASLIVKNEIAENNPELLEAFLKEYEKSINWLTDNAEKAGEYSEELETGINRAAVVSGLRRSNIRYVSSKAAREAIEGYLKVLFEYSPESIGGKLPDEGFYLEK